MPLFIKPQFNSVWATTGVKLTPEPAKISQGWVVEIPPYEYENWSANRQDALLAHLNQLGIPQWDGTVEYQGGKSYVQGVTTGVVYRAITTNTNINPELDVSNNWRVAFESAGVSLLKSQNLADVPDKALARTNLGIATTEFYDNRYLIKNNNLADVPNKATARNNLDVFSKGEIISRLFPPAKLDYFATNYVPPGWLRANGQSVSRTQYSVLFSAIGTYYGSGNGSTTFNVPDWRGEFVRGWDDGRGVDPNRSVGSIQESQNRAHTHTGRTTTDGEHTHSVGFRANGATEFTSPDDVLKTNGNNYSQSTNAAGSHYHTLSIDNSGGYESRPRNVALVACISTGQFP